MWAEHLAAVRRAVDDDVRAREYDGFFGRTTIGATWDDFYGFDLVVHGWDLATATGQPYRPATELVAEVEAFARQVLDPLRGSGAFGPEVAPSDEATPIERLVAYTGRTP